MKVLVTGSEGFIGRNLVKYLKDRGFEVFSLDISGGELRLDVTEFDTLSRSLSNIDFDAVIHLAAIANIPESIKDPYKCFKVNVYGTLNILEIASRKNIRRFIYASSANVYGLPLKLPVDEDTPFNPRTPYDYSKVAAEAIVQSYWKIKDRKSVV